MRCGEVRPTFEKYLHVELEPGLMRGIQLHLGGCRDCRELLSAVGRNADAVMPLYLVAKAHGELSRQERSTSETHLAYCESCRIEYERLRAAGNELIKNLSQYQLSRFFQRWVMQEWKAHRVGRRTRYSQRGLADLIERAEAGNAFSYQRHIDRFKDYAYVAAFLAVRDFHWASEIARQIFRRGMPVFHADLTLAEFLGWLRKKAAAIGREGGWIGADEQLGSGDKGLSGYTGSYKLRRHRLILRLFEDFAERAQYVFLFYYVQRLGYSDISSLLDLSRLEVLTILDDTTRAARKALQEDAAANPRRRRGWN